jgi:serine/threonine protein kinase
MPTLAEHDALPSGARLGEFEIQRILGVGGFGVVYLALDHALQRQVAIKEYMPGTLATRGPDLEVVVRAENLQETYALGLRSFVNEARLLARFDHPALVKVYRFWEAHGTAYMVMPWYQGQTLLQVRRKMASPPDETWLRQLILPLLGALECLHRESVFHRDIAPDNILLVDDEAGAWRPVLLDLGAARKVIGDHTQALTAIVKPSFAPIEQYAETAQLRQGAWTDLYALAAVVHFCITGRSPVPATVRAVHDEMPSLSALSDGLASSFGVRYGDAFVRAVDQALAVKPQDRPQSVADWRAALLGWTPSAPLKPGAGDQAFMTTVPSAGRLTSPPTWPVAPAGGGTVSSPAPRARGPAEPSVAHAGHGVRWLRWAFGALLVLGIVAIWWSQRHMTSRRPVAPVQQAVTADSATVASATSASAVASAPRRKAAKASAKTGAASVAGASAPDAAPVRSAPTNRPAPATPETSEPLNPRKACAGRSFIMLAICMKRHCSRPDYAAHPECERMRQQEAAQRTPY